MGLSAGVVWYFLSTTNGREIVSPAAKLKLRSLDKYSIENLGKRDYDSQLIFDEAVATTSAYTAFEFHFDSDGKKVSGLAHVPTKCLSEKCPVVSQFRGYVPLEIYQPGVGTNRSAEVFAQNGFVSLAPDFLGYGTSDNPSGDVFEARFETYTTAMSLLAAVKKWSKFDGNLFIWGHSNGGQIALTILEILGEESEGYPTVLWAPVSKPFPYSILYYTDEADDSGKALRKELAGFEDNYDVFNYDLTRYLDKISAPIQLHQGTIDEAVPQKWSDELVVSLKKNGVDVRYFVYPGADHNLSGSWDTVVERNIDFYSQNMAKNVLQ